LLVDRHQLEFALWGRNLANKRYATSVFDHPFGYVVSTPGAPRSLGVDVTKRF